MSEKPAKKKLIVLGVIAGAHGVRGDVRVKSFTEAPETLFTYGPLLSDRGDTLLEAANTRPGKDHYIVTPVTPRSKEEWDALKGTRLHVPHSALPVPDEDEFYIEDLVGLTAHDRSGTRVGKVKAVQNYGAGDLLEILPTQSGHPSFFVPFTLEDIPQLDFETGQITLADPAAWADTSSGDEEEKR
ncbi:ribosome maturation factor RimM [Henriciella sp.]|uniref:ribosome maturation factor RimM n=1 Tax=Henriciella sp. TaxID=1968823 RepID=UPI0026221ABF|nr:ribosome maturation factor RimM [Henriciella sp.]